MASTYSNLKIQLMATGENTGTWGNVTNENLGTALEQAIVETATVTFASANVTLTLTDTNAKQNARALRLNLAGTTAGARDLIVPAIQKPYLVNNGTADTITVKVTGQTGIAVPAGKSMLLYNNGTDVGLAFNRVVADLIGNGSGITAMNASEITTGSLANARTTASSANGASTIVARDASGNFTANVITANGSAITALNASSISTGTLAVGRGGTGATTLNSEAVIIGNTTGAVKFVDPGTTGNVLTSNGTSWVSEAAGGGGVGYAFNKYTAPAPTTPGSFTWTKPAGLVGIRVIIASGGGGGSGSGGGGNAGGGGGGIAEGYIPAPAIPGPVTVTVGGGGAGGAAGPGIQAGSAGATTSFGAFFSITGGGAPNTGPGPVLSSGIGGGTVSLNPAVELFYSSFGLPGNPEYPAAGSFAGGSLMPPQGSGLFNHPGGAGSNIPTLNPYWPQINPNITQSYATTARWLYLSFPGAGTPPSQGGLVYGGMGAALYGKYANGSPGMILTGPPPLNFTGQPATANYGISAGGGGGGSYGGSGPGPSGGAARAGGNGGPGMVIIEEFY